jgi:hypothetical protein
MTVAELIAELQTLDPKLEVGFCTGPDTDLELLSVYQGPDNNPTHVWFDLQEPDDELDFEEEDDGLGGYPV